MLTCARDALRHIADADVPLDAAQIRAPAAGPWHAPPPPEGPDPAAPTAHDEAHAQALAAASTTLRVHR